MPPAADYCHACHTQSLENVIYILLFLVFMLVGESELAKKNQASDEAEQQIYV